MSNDSQNESPTLSINFVLLSSALRIYGQTRGRTSHRIILLPPLLILISQYTNPKVQTKSLSHSLRPFRSQPDASSRFQRILISSVDLRSTAGKPCFNRKNAYLSDSTPGSGSPSLLRLRPHGARSTSGSTLETQQVHQPERYRLLHDLPPLDRRLQLPLQRLPASPRHLSGCIRRNLGRWLSANLDFGRVSHPRGRFVSSFDLHGRRKKFQGRSLLHRRLSSEERLGLQSPR